MVLPGRLPAAEMFPAGAPDLRTRYLDLPSGLRVRVVEAGEKTAPAILLIHGWGCSTWIFHDTIAPLADAGFHAIAFDLKGHGLSDKPYERNHYTTAALRDHVIEVIDTLGIDKLRLVGHSMGGALAGHVAAKIPDRIESVALVAPVGFAGVRALPFFKLITSRMIAPLLPSLARRWIVKTMLGLVYGHMRPVSEKDVDEFWAPTQFPMFSRALREILHHFNWSEPFPELRMPWMTIVGELDRLSLARDAARYEGRGGSAPTLVIPKVGHVVLDEDPEVVNGALMSFFGARS